MQIQYINNLRALACYLVILTHSAMPATSDSFGIYMVLFSIIGAPSSELFVMISSSLLAPTKLNMLAFYKKRFSKLLGPFLFWSIAILLLNFYQKEISLNELFSSIVLIPFVPATGVYWFVYTICGLYFIIPLISPWLANSRRKELLFIIMLWGITLLLPIFNYFFKQDFYNITGDYYFILVYFGGFIGYLFFGVYLRKYPLIFSNKYKCMLVLITLLVVGTLPILYGYIFDRNILKIVTENLSISSAIYVFVIFTFFQNFKLPHAIESIFNVIAKYSFGIYLIHIIVIRDFIWVLLENNRLAHPIIETPFISIVSLIICFAIVKLISMLPNSKYIIGA